MNKHEATELGIRLIAILNLTNIVSMLPYLLSFKDVAIKSGIVGVHNPWINPLIIFGFSISILLWFNANRIAQWMWRGSKENNEGTSPTAIQLKIILFSAIGLYLLVSVIPDALEFFVYFGQKVATGSKSIGWSDSANAVGFLLRILISGWLLFNPDGVVAVLQRGKNTRSKRKTA